jgi:hypothetical protein
METLGGRPNLRRATVSTKLIRAMLALLVIVVTDIAAMRADAANRFAVVGVENSTHVTIRVYHKWGDGEWKQDVIPAGGKKWYWWTYANANDNHSPKFHVRFDSDLNPGKIFTINYDLTKNAAPAHDWEDAQKYVFKYDGNRNYIDLYRRS